MKAVCPADLDWQEGPVPRVTDVPLGSKLLIWMADADGPHIFVSHAKQVGAISPYWSSSPSLLLYTARVKYWAVLEGPSPTELIIKDIIE